MESVAAFLQHLLGIEPRALAWAMVGGVFGAQLAPPAGRIRQVLVFAASSCICALGGTAAAVEWHKASATLRDVWAAGLAFAFHPLTTKLVTVVPEAVATMVGGLIAARGGQQPAPPSDAAQPPAKPDAKGDQP